MTLQRARILKRVDTPTLDRELPPTLDRGRPDSVEAATPRVGQGSALPAGRRLAKVVMDARAEAERILAGAEARAVAAAKEAGAAAREEEIAKLAATALAMRAADEQRSERDLARTIDVAVLLAERLVGEALAVDPKRIGELAAAALSETRGSRQVRIEANPADVGALGDVLRELAQVAAIEPNAELGRGSLVVHTDLGRVDGTLRPQLERLAAVVRDSLAASSKDSR